MSVNKNNSCKRVGCPEKFHTCSGCDVSEWEWHYCRLECFELARDAGFRAAAAKYGIAPEKMNDLASDLSEWIYT